jgi:hypothetical protein
LLALRLKNESQLSRLKAAAAPTLPDKEEVSVAKGIEKGKKENKPKVSIKEKQKKKKEKKASRPG